MLRKTSLALSLCLSALVGACTANEATVSLTDTASLTEKSGDKLFTLKLDDAPNAYDLGKLVVKATPDGKDPIGLTISATDTDKNGKLDKGESVDCSEPATNALDASLKGTEVDVDVYKLDADNKEEKIAHVVWAPAK
jgi:hypothetical protein